MQTLGTADRHRRRHVAERNALEQHLHIGRRIDRDAAMADLPKCLRIVGVAARQRASYQPSDPTPMTDSTCVPGAGSAIKTSHFDANRSNDRHCEQACLRRVKTFAMPGASSTTVVFVVISALSGRRINRSG